MRHPIPTDVPAIVRARHHDGALPVVPGHGSRAENLGLLGKSLLETEGHDVLTIADQRMMGAEDERVYEVCRHEDRLLVTLDRDFGHTLRFPPEATASIIVLECKGRLSPSIVERLGEACGRAEKTELEFPSAKSPLLRSQRRPCPERCRQ